MSDIDATAVAWLERFAVAVGEAVPSAEEIATLLSLAGHAAHASHRQAAPVACWLAARAGVSPDVALELARGLD
jgi:hypothetical protein